MLTKLHETNHWTKRFDNLGEYSKNVKTEISEIVVNPDEPEITEKISEGGEILFWNLFGMFNYNQIFFTDILFLFNFSNWNLHYKSFQQNFFYYRNSSDIINMKKDFIDNKDNYFTFEIDFDKLFKQKNVFESNVRYKLERENFLPYVNIPSECNFQEERRLKKYE